MPVRSAPHIVRMTKLLVFTYYYCFYYFNPQTSLLSDNSHPKEDKSPKEDGLKNGDIDIDFSQLKLDDKGEY